MGAAGLLPPGELALDGFRVSGEQLGLVLARPQVLVLLVELEQLLAEFLSALLQGGALLAADGGTAQASGGGQQLGVLLLLGGQPVLVAAQFGALRGQVPGLGDGLDAGVLGVGLLLDRAAGQEVGFVAVGLLGGGHRPGGQRGSGVQGLAVELVEPCVGVLAVGPLRPCRRPLGGGGSGLGFGGQAAAGRVAEPCPLAVGQGAGGGLSSSSGARSRRARAASAASWSRASCRSRASAR